MATQTEAKVGHQNLVARTWVQVGPSASHEAKDASKEKKNGRSLRVMSFNVLADVLAQQGSFVLCPAELLEWHGRAQQIMKEIERVDADIVGLAECNHFTDFFQPRMKALGYDGIWTTKGDSCAAVRLGGLPDGAAVFWRSSLLAQIADLPLPQPKALSFATQSVAALCFTGADAKNFPPIVFSMMHLKAKTGFEQERLEQVTSATKIVAAVAQDVLNTTNQVPLLFMCGDYNAEEAEPCIQLMKDTRMTLTTGAGDTSTSEAKEHIASIKNVQFGLREAHAAKPLGWTTWKFRQKENWDQVKEVKHTIDFIFYSDVPSLQVTSTFGLPDDKLPSLQKGLPCAVYPSDHLSVAASFAVAAMTDTVTALVNASSTPEELHT